MGPYEGRPKKTTLGSGDTEEAAFSGLPRWRGSPFSLRPEFNQAAVYRTFGRYCKTPSLYRGTDFEVHSTVLESGME
jgi:hypothetical protein